MQGVLRDGPSLRLLAWPLRHSLEYRYDIFGSLLTIKTRKDNDDGSPGSGTYETTTQHTYDPFERLLSSRDDNDKDGAADGDHQVYCYDALDRRDRKVTGIASIDEQDDTNDSFAQQRQACTDPPTGSRTLDYSYVGLTEQLTRENSVDGDPRTYDYTSQGERLGQRSKARDGESAKFRPYETDAQGSAIAIEDAEPEASVPEPGDRYQLDPYGDTLNDASLTTEAKDNPFRYQGFYLDSGVGTYDMQARAYRPSLGRFLTQDRYEDPSADVTLQTDPLTANRYTFLAGNPTSTEEDDGHRVALEGPTPAKRHADTHATPHGGNDS